MDKKKGEERSMCWLAAARHYCTHCNKNGGMEERVFDSFVLSPSQLPPFTSPLIQSSKSAYFLQGPILKCSFLKTLSKIIFSNLIFIFLFRIIYKINYFLNFILLYMLYFLINFKTKFNLICQILFLFF
jgi:hypothetical protein